MSSNNGTSGIGGFRNLRAIFENKPSEGQSASPPSRGRSPAHSEASIPSRPVSKVRASFVAVERPGDIEAPQHWGLRKISDVTGMADIKQELENAPLVNGTANACNSRSNGVHREAEPQTLQNTADDTPTQVGLGSILKGSEFEASPPASRSKAGSNGAVEPPISPTPQKKNFAASRMNGKSTPRSPSKAIGSKIKDAASSNHNQPPPPTRLNTTKEAKPIKPPPTRQVPPARVSTKSPTSPRTPRALVSPKMEKPTTRGSAAKPMAVLQSAKNAVPSQQGKKSPTIPRETRRTSLNPPNPAAGRQGPSSPKTHGLKDTKPMSPETKPRPTRVPASVAAPTTASAARSGNPTTLNRKPTVTRRDPPPAKTITSTAPVVKKPTRTSLPAQTNGTDRAKPRDSAARKAPTEGFLARMMRPTASSAQKTHEKVAPSSPPQSKRSAPVQAAKDKARTSMPVADEDKENSHRGGQGGGQGMDTSPSTAEDRQVETNGNGKAEPQPLNDITPAADPEEVTVDSNTNAPEALSA